MFVFVFGIFPLVELGFLACDPLASVMFSVRWDCFDCHILVSGSFCCSVWCVAVAARIVVFGVCSGRFLVARFWAAMDAIASR